MARRLMTAIYLVPAAEFDSTEYSDTAKITKRNGIFRVVDAYVYCDEEPPAYWTDSDGAPLRIDEEFLANQHLQSIVFKDED